MIQLFDTRNEMVAEYCKEGYKLCEIGVFVGEFANVLLQTRPSELVLIDPWDCVSVSGDVDGNNFRHADLPKVYEALENAVKSIPSVNLCRGYSGTVLPTFPDDTFDCVYIDGDHSYTGCKIDLELSLQKVKPGGILMGHDYEMNFAKAKNNHNFGVKEAVDEFCAKYGLSITAKAMDGCVSYAIQIPTPKPSFISRD